MTSNPSNKVIGGSSSIRPDIQALRGIAVLVVVIFHARLGIVDGGYLGVDIFFVISGFLITSMIKSQVEAGSFRFSEFYFRRAKRLLPAAYLTFAVTALFSVFLLTGNELRQFADQLFGAVTFTANIVLMRQGSYFGGDADLKPLLHTWSLSIEEQYYLVMPALLYFLPRRWWLGMIVAVIALSFALCLGIGLWRPDIAFYVFPTRAWEMGLGSLGAFIIGRPATLKLAIPLFWPSLALLCLLPFFPFGGFHPGLDALLACTATLIIILRAHPLLNSAITRPLAFVGDFSYSLYLVHWPLFALATNMWVGELPTWFKTVGIFASMILAWMQYHFVEDPVRRARMSASWSRAGAIVAMSALTISIPYVAIALGRAPETYIEARRGNTGLGPACISNDGFRGHQKYVPPPSCMTGADPTMLVWGDSYAMHLVPGIVAVRGDERIVQATKYVCGPLLGVAPVGHFTGTTQTLRWAKGCLDYNQDVIDYLRTTPSVKTVVLSSVFKQYMTASDFHLLKRDATGDREIAGGIEPALAAIGATINSVRAMGRKVVVIAPPPALDWDAGMCSERRLRGLPTLGPHADCAISDAAYQSKRRLVLAFMKDVTRRHCSDVIMFDDYLRKGDRYETLPGKDIWYIANGHLSYQGSIDLARKMDLVTRARDQAR
jgi:peptidoglycan/LPS O-acetylase OafA/YrhL